MPGIIVFGRRWAVGSDDFVFPAAGEIMLRIVWLFALSIVLGVHNSNLSTCTNGHLLKIYYIGMLIILPLAIILSSTIMYMSMQGTITNDEPRRSIPSLIVVKLFLFFLEIVWTGIGTYWAFGEHVETCSSEVVIVVKGATIVGWILLFLLLVGVVVVFDTFGSTLAETPAELQRLWKLRCKLLCCCCNIRSNFNNKSAAFEDVTSIIAEYLAGVDFVITDIAAALILVQRQQQRELRQRPANEATQCRIAYTGAATSSAAEDLSPRPKDWMSIAEASAFMKYALASYGWPFFVFDNQCTGPFKLCCRCKCCLCLRPWDNIYGDNCCGCNTSAILEQAHVKVADIFYANYHNRLYEIPFYIVMDHETKSVVVSVRGTLSFDDALTDMSANLEEILVDGVPNAKAHKGILQAASYIASMINQHHLLEEAFVRVPDYKLVIVGHSLGAGAAAILSILLKPQYPNLRCFSFSPPGWLLSLELSHYAEDFVCSVVVGKDFIPRLGLVTIQKLKEKMINVVRQSNEPKYKILAGSAWRTIFCYCIDSSSADNNDADVETGSNASLLRNSTSPLRKQSYTDEQSPHDNTVQELQQPGVVYIPLFMPGIVLYLEESEPGRGCLGTPTYSAFWMKPESFDEILVSGMAMVHDHVPNVVFKALQSLNSDCHVPPTSIVA